MKFELQRRFLRLRPLADDLKKCNKWWRGIIVYEWWLLDDQTYQTRPAVGSSDLEGQNLFRTRRGTCIQIHQEGSVTGMLQLWKICETQWKNEGHYLRMPPWPRAFFAVCTFFPFYVNYPQNDTTALIMFPAFLLLYTGYSWCNSVWNSRECFVSVLVTYFVLCFDLVYMAPWPGLPGPF